MGCSRRSAKGLSQGSWGVGRSVAPSARDRFLAARDGFLGTLVYGLLAPLVLVFSLRSDYSRFVRSLREFSRFARWCLLAPLGVVFSLRSVVFSLRSVNSSFVVSLRSTPLSSSPRLLDTPPLIPPPLPRPRLPRHTQLPRDQPLHPRRLPPLFRQTRLSLLFLDL